ncbi:DUF6588 family protein [Mangrovimonas aestuarii]|uniref:DUF6588 family protein n=1 Tax=Mangrovimonas aestuarii TaxID=3018443 RepID=UPI0023792FDB|nr:DUF6588 family protein [Mangrovimonas aestuarii]
MKILSGLILGLVFMGSVHAQGSINELLAAGIEDAKHFTTGYIAPASDALAYGINTNWFNNAKVPKRFSFEISIVGNMTFVKDKHNRFNMETADYENIRFEDGSSSKMVATALGENNPDVNVVITYDDELFGPILGDQEFVLTLPQGLASEGLKFVPNGYLQASFVPFKGTQVRAHFFPQVKSKDFKVGMYGFGVQYDFTSLLPADKVLPLAVSGLVAYTHLDGFYDFTDKEYISGENQRVDTDVNTLTYQLIVGTKLPVINFYGALGFLSSKNRTDLLGTFVVADESLLAGPAKTVKDPFSIKSKTQGITGTLGANLKLGVFGLNAAYTLADFNSAVLGINFGF